MGWGKKVKAKKDIGSNGNKYAKTMKRGCRNGKNIYQIFQN